MEKEVYKNRSIPGCIKAGYTLFCSNVMNILRRNWLPLLTLALTGGICMGWGIVSGAGHAGQGSKGAGIAVSILLNVAMVCALTWYTARTTNMLNENGLACNLRRNAKLALASVLLVGVLLLLAYATGMALTHTQTAPTVNETPGISVQAWVYPALALLILVGMVPFAYSSMRYIQEQEAKFGTHVLGGYKIGLRYIGFIFSTLFLFAIIILFLTLILIMPVYILAMANGLSQTGVMRGDPDTLPGYFTLLVYGTSILTFVILTAMMTVGIYVDYYVYGAITAKKRARENRKKIQTEALSL